MITQLVHASSTTRPLSADDLLQIVRASRRNNAAVGVTGALLCHDGNVMQVLEGPPDAVDCVVTRVEADPRHTGVLPLLRETADARAFPEWSMGLLRPQDVPAEGVAGLFDVASPGPERARRMLQSFWSVVGR